MRRVGRRALKSFFGHAVVFGIIAVSIGFSVGQITAEPGKGTLLGASPEEILEVNIRRGFGVPIIAVGFPAASLGTNVLDATTDFGYLGSSDDEAVYRADFDTATVSFVGNAGAGNESISGLGFQTLDATTDAYSFPASQGDGSPAPGRLFAAINRMGGEGADYLATINLASGAASLIGPFGVDGVEAIAFAPDGTLWGAVSSSSSDTPGLYTIDTNTGLATFFVALENGGPNGTPGPPSGGLAALQFGCDGTLYGGTAAAVDDAVESLGGGLQSGLSGLSGGLQGSGLNVPAGTTGGAAEGATGPTDGGRLVTIDPVTGLFTYGRRQAVRDGDLSGLAFSDPCLTLFQPTPGLANAINSLFLVGATPARNSRLYVGMGPGSSTVSVPLCGAVELGIDGAELRANSTANADGEVLFDVFFPRGFSGRTLFFQAVDRQSCTVSNVGAFTIP